MGRSHAIIYEEYFSDLNIIKALINYRLNLAKKRHDQFFIERIVQSENLKPEKANLELGEIFPPRNHWKRPCFKKRINPKKKTLYFESLLFTINYYRSQPIDKRPQWVVKLNAFIAEIRSKALYSPTVELPSPKLLADPKNKKDGDFELYRPISIVEDLASRVLLKLLANYLMDQLDVVFKKSSFAFRRRKSYRNRVPTHHDCYREIKRFKKENTEMYVSECDIKAFFDTISHSEIRNSYTAIKEELFKLNGTRIFGRADDFFESFLNSYSIDYAISESKLFFESRNIKGRLHFPKDELLSIFYSGNTEALKEIGIPQGTPLSVLIANLILHDNDKLMEEKFKDSESFLYMRYCDDMIILSKEKNVTNQAYEDYIQLLKEKKLLHHSEKSLFPYTDSSSKKDFWDRKSRKGYQWSKNSYPWITFVGYQIRYDNFVRIRLSSIKNEMSKQKEFVKSILIKIKKEIKRGNFVRIRKSHRSILNRVINRMIASGVGRVSLLGKKTAFGFSWINGFRGILKDEKVFRNNLKELDRNRDKQLESLNEELLKVLQNHKIKTRKPKRMIVEKYPGPPFSYYYRSFPKKKEISK
ncbi:reverse transcriptase domain-containing protein [Leptospira santarosai]|uniref:reverse transcriptase domain-containing protein n=1 Tax=Leptospira santarosai TaxID=28183 RepID=UPI0009637858|nr:reverse transcriptase domain-containing protein [Leptospira santarosai]OLY63674.1 RNA-directed DNA polymerase [Leptospira santarosai serovar Grippotyphosa]ONF76700.1 RNA-directed DNA polymerase [Leptospira santarosai serovar Bananal]ONF84596.1 RNA-directed DNA polymerase [Leptospira santarosai serovar Grippotyphosa]